MPLAAWAAVAAGSWFFTSDMGGLTRPADATERCPLLQWRRMPLVAWAAEAAAVWCGVWWWRVYCVVRAVGCIPGRLFFPELLHLCMFGARGGVCVCGADCPRLVHDFGAVLQGGCQLIIRTSGRLPSETRLADPNPPTLPGRLLGRLLLSELAVQVIPNYVLKNPP